MSLHNQIAQRILADTETKPTEGCFVSIYTEDQQYGGPEEGGWWVTRRSLVASRHFPTRELAEAYLAAITAEIERANRAEAPARARAFASLPDPDEEPLPDSGEGYIPRGFTDGGQMFAIVEDLQGESDNSHEPIGHYE